MFEFPLTSRCPLLDAIVAGLAPWVHLYVNNPTVTWCLIKADLHEATSGGYAPKLAINFAPAVLVGAVARAVADPLVWTRTDGMPAEQVYGYFITQGEDGDLLWCSLPRTDPFPWGLAGDQITLVPTLEFGPLASDLTEPYTPVCPV